MSRTASQTEQIYRTNYRQYKIMPQGRAMGRARVSGAPRLNSRDLAHLEEHGRQHQG